MFTKIKDPVSKTEHSIYSDEGKKLVKNYVKYFNKNIQEQKGGI